MTKLKWLGQRLPKTVELPIPFLSLSAKTGEVVCNPVGEFDEETADKLLGMAPDFWERVADETCAPAAAPVVVKKRPGFAVWQEQQRALKAAKKLGPSQSPTEGSQAPSPEREGQMEVV